MSNPFLSKEHRDHVRKTGTVPTGSDLGLALDALDELQPEEKKPAEKKPAEKKGLFSTGKK